MRASRTPLRLSRGHAARTADQAGKGPCGQAGRGKHARERAGQVDRTGAGDLVFFVRSQARREKEQAMRRRRLRKLIERYADCKGRKPDGRPQDCGGPSRQAETEVRARACRAGRRSRHDHAGAHRRGSAPGRPRLDHCAARARPANPGEWRRPANVAVRRARHGGDRLGRLPRRTRRSSAAIPIGRASAPASARSSCVATERNLGKIAAAVTREKRPLRGAAKIGVRIRRRARRIPRWPNISISRSPTRSWPGVARPIKSSRRPRSTAVAVRTSLPADAIDDKATVRAYKSLSMVERAPVRCC